MTKRKRPTPVAVAAPIAPATTANVEDTTKEIDWLRPLKVAALLGVSQKTLHRLNLKHGLPGVKLGNTWRIPRVALIKWIGDNYSAGSGGAELQQLLKDVEPNKHVA